LRNQSSLRAEPKVIKASQYAEDNTQNFTPEREAELLNRSWSLPVPAILVVSHLLPQLEMALSSVYKLLHLHNLRKLAPDKRHLQSNPVCITERLGENSPKHLPKSARIGSK